MDNCEFKETSADDWHCKTKINGQTVLVEFQSEKTNKNLYWNIALNIFSKRKNIEKNNDQIKNTGHIGLSGLLFARKAVQEFEFVVKEEYLKFNQGHKMFIYCSWLDNKRRDIYTRGLESLGYKITMHHNKKILAKEIKL